MKRHSGFTLVEILIVVIILGILAAIVIPQFTSASQDARNSALSSDLQTLRSQLELYRIQHLDKYPNQIAAVGTDATKFVEQLTSKTDNAGGSIGTGTLGAYVQTFPTNPFVAANGNKIVVGDGSGFPTGATGWYFNTTTGKVSPNDTDHSAL